MHPPLHPARYLPLKEQAGELRHEVAALQKRVVAEELKVGGIRPQSCSCSLVF